MKKKKKKQLVITDWYTGATNTYSQERLHLLKRLEKESIKKDNLLIVEVT